MEILANERLDHLGIVAGTIKELGIIEFIDSRIATSDAENITAGEAVAGMILNGLGFSDRPISLTPQFFENKPLELLFRPKVKAEHFNRFKLGRSLDDIYDYGCDLLFSEIANQACKKVSIDTRFQSLDTTTFSLSGKYDSDSDEHEINVTHGYSKDHRPDLKQVALELIVSHDGGVPLISQSFDGNVSDNEVFKKRSKAIVNGLKNSEPLGYLVADSKLYFENNAENLKDLPFITRIPGNIKEESKVIRKALETGDWEKVDEENRYQSFSLEHYGIRQRWVVVYSKEAANRANKAVDKAKNQEKESLEKALKKLNRKKFGCEIDAQSEVEKLQKSLKLHNIVSINYLPIIKYKHSGRPNKGSEGESKRWQIEASFEVNENAIENRVNKKSCYVLGTNVSLKELSDKEVIAGYKSQNSVEMGFRFLKDPVFFTSSLFLKKASRISGLLMVMTLALLVYSIAQRHLRHSLKIRKTTLPNQIKKAIERPTLRWIFQLLEGINWVTIKLQDHTERIIQGLTQLKKEILSHFITPIQVLYGLNQ